MIDMLLVSHAFDEYALFLTGRMMMAELSMTVNISPTPLRACWSLWLCPDTVGSGDNLWAITSHGSVDARDVHEQSVSWILRLS